MVGRGSRRGIDAHADEPAEQNVSGESGSAGRGNVLAELDDLRLIATLLEGDRNIRVALGDHRAWRDASGRHFKTGYDGLGARWR